jgi:hypothetical protein
MIIKEEKKFDIVDQLVQETQTLSVSTGEDESETQLLTYTKEEIETIQCIYDKLKGNNIDPNKIGLRSLALTAIVSKLRIDEACDKYKKFLIALETCDVGSLSFSDTDINTLVSDSDVAKQLTAYAPCGKDFEGRSIFWIKGHEILPSEEKHATQAGVLYWLAIHADDKSLHEGITFCIDTSSRTSLTKYGNESKLQKINQSYPLRPQAIKIAGASKVTRFAINALLKIASLFPKQKILQRIQFVTVEEAVECVPKESAPKYLGGGGGKIDNVEQWVLKRINSFPIPDISR